MSVQGEGSLAGQAAFFIRFHGCNLTCDFGNGFKCDDTNHTKPNYEEIGSLDLMIKARKAGTHNIIITGGECSNDKNIHKLIRYFRREGYHVSAETNGNHIERLAGANLITYSPKKRGRLVTYEDYKEMEGGGMPDIELKLLAGTQDTPDKIWEDYPLKYIQAIGNEHSFDEANMKYCVDFVTKNTEWHLSTQLQKLYKVS